MKPKSLIRPLAALSLIALCQSARGADKYWDPSPLTGTWDTTTTNWSATPSGAGTPDQLWLDNDSAFFDQTGTYAVTVSGSRTATALTIAAGDVTFTGSEISTGTLAAGGVGTSKINNVLSGVSTITKSGSGTLELAGNNTLTGDINFNSASGVNTGFLRLTHNNALGDNATAKTINLTDSTGGAIGGIELAGGVTISSNKHIQIGGRTIGPTFAFLRNVSGSNTWNGNLLINKSGGQYTIDTLAGTLTLGGNLQNDVSGGTRAFTFRNNGDSIISGTIKNNGTGLTRIDKGGTGTMTITSTTGNTATGGITITEGILSLGDGTTGNDGVIANGNAVSISSGANLTFNRFGSQTYNGAISGSGTVTKLGAGTQTLTGPTSTTTPYSYTGATLISQGTLDANRTTGLALGAGNVTVSSGATLRITNHADGGQLAYANNITLSGNGVGGAGALSFVNSGGFDMSGTVGISGGTTIRTNSNNQITSSLITFTNTISGSGGLTLDTSNGSTSGTPQFALSGASTYTGSTILTSSGSNTTTSFRVTLTGGTDRLPTGTDIFFRQRR